MGTYGERLDRDEQKNSVYRQSQMTPHLEGFLTLLTLQPICQNLQVAKSQDILSWSLRQSRDLAVVHGQEPMWSQHKLQCKDSRVALL